jgi:hypothetical protein
MDLRDHGIHQAGVLSGLQMAAKAVSEEHYEKNDGE